MSTWGEPCQSHEQVRIHVFGHIELWHREGIEAIKFAEMLAMRTQYGRFLSSRVKDTDVQTYACRAIRGTTDTHSLHSWPRALDIRPAFNPLREDGVLVTDFDRFGLDDGTEFIGAFLRAGFRWGGTWSHDIALARRALANNRKKVYGGRVDPMHFELDGPPETGWAKRLRAYKRRNPGHMSKVLESARAESIDDLLHRWKAGAA